MPDIQEAKCFEFTVQILPPPLRYISVYALGDWKEKVYGNV